MRKILIIGAGFAGLSCLERLVRDRKRLGLDITVIDKAKSSSFLPSLPDSIGKGVNPGHLAYNVDRFIKSKGCRFMRGGVFSVDLEKKEVSIQGMTLGYDYLVIASGSETNFYGNKEIEEYALKLDDIDDAEKIRRQLEDKSFDCYLVSGGGYTGIEVAANLRQYLKPGSVQKRVAVIERQPEILGPLPRWMKEFVLDNLKRLNIEVFVNSVIARTEGRRVYISDDLFFDNALLVWAAGVRTSDFIQKLAVEKNPQGRIKVDEYLRLNENCFVAGDAGYFAYKDIFLRMAVQFAIAQGDLAAGNIIRCIAGEKLKKYRPVDLGYVVPMANNRSCGVVMGASLKGFLPTFLHYLMCVYRLRGIKNKAGFIADLIKGGGKMADFSIFVLRLGLGIMFMAHGLQKAFGFFNGSGIRVFADWLASLGLKLPSIMAYAAAYTELVCGLFLILGIFVRISSTLLLVIMSVAVYLVHWQHGFFMTTGGIEYNFIIACVCISLIISGPGKFALTKKF